ncbi:MAG: carbon storage regulator CsrA [Peptostreptococcaceae bacterium]
MLVLTRKQDESFLIGDDVEIKILKIDDKSIKIGIEAPKSKSILRKELHQKIQEENKEFTLDISHLNKLLSKEEV